MENTHENENLNNETAAPEENNYVPRPAWQVWLARLGLVLFIVFVIYQLIQISRGGI